MSPEEARAKHTPTTPRGIVASRPTKERAEPKLALEKAAERKPSWCVYVFSQQLDSGQLLFS